MIKQNWFNVNPCVIKFYLKVKENINEVKKHEYYTT